MTYNLVTEFSVAVDTNQMVSLAEGQHRKLHACLHLDFQVNVTTTGCSVDHGETEGISSTLGDTIRESRLLVLGRLLDFVRVQVTLVELLVKIFQFNTGDDIQGVDNVAQTLAHLSSF